jgi:ribosome-associated protein
MKDLEKEISLEYVRSSGPGGQNVNKVSTAVQLRFNITGSTSLTPEEKARLMKIAGKRVTNDGILIIEAHTYRTQEKNREDAVQRLYALVKKASERPKSRKKTRPSKASKEARLQLKKKRGEIKKLRQNKRGLEP